MEEDLNLTNGFYFSFNVILGYHIWPKIRFNNEPFIIKNEFGINFNNNI